MMCGDGKESIRPITRSSPIIIQECPYPAVSVITPDKLKMAIKEGLGVYRS